MTDLSKEFEKAAIALERLAKSDSNPTVRPEGEEMTPGQFTALLETFRTIGPAALKKSLSSLTEEQLMTMKSVLEKATSLQAEAVPQPKPIHDVLSKPLPYPEGGADEEDEKLVQEKNKSVKPQGDDSELKGQVIEDGAGEITPDTMKKGQLTDAVLAAVVARMRARNLSKSACMGALEQYGYGKEKLEKMYDDAPDADAAKKTDADIKDGLKQKIDPKPEAKIEEGAPAVQSAPAPIEAAKVVAAPAPEKKTEEEAEPKPEAEKKPEPAKENPFKKAVVWTNPIAPYNESSPKRGRNAHYTVDAMIADAEAKSDLMKKSGTWMSDPYAGEVLAKAELQGPSKVTVNDLIEKSLDMDSLRIAELQDRRDAKPAGAFTVSSFDQNEVVQKALPKGEGARGGHVIGHTKTGKPIYANPKHQDHGNFSDEEHYDAHLAHTQHSIKHSAMMNKPSSRGMSGQHVASASAANHHEKAAKQHLSRVKSRNLDEIHPHLKTIPDMNQHARDVATSKFKTPEADQSSTSAAPEQKA